MERKENKVGDYSQSIWGMQPRYFDGQVVMEYLREIANGAGFEKILSIPEVKWTMGKLEEALLASSKIEILNSKLVAGVALLRKVTDLLIELNDSSLLTKHAAQITDYLLKSIWWMTN